MPTEHTCSIEPLSPSDETVAAAWHAEGEDALLDALTQLQHLALNERVPIDHKVRGTGA